MAGGLWHFANEGRVSDDDYDLVEREHADPALSENGGPEHRRLARDDHEDSFNANVAWSLPPVCNATSTR